MTVIITELQKLANESIRDADDLINYSQEDLQYGIEKLLDKLYAIQYLADVFSEEILGED